LVVVGNKMTNSVDLLDVDTNSTLISVPLQQSIKSISQDPYSGEFYISLSNDFVVLNLMTGFMKYVTIPLNPLGISAGNKYIYVLCSAVVYMLDKQNFTIVTKVAVNPLSSAIVASSNDQFFVTGLIRYSSSIGMYLYTHVNGSWSQSQSGLMINNANTLVLSPNNEHVSIVCGGGNEIIYSTSDIYPLNFFIQGHYETGAYPIGGAYTLDQRYFLTSNYENVLVFDTQIYELVTQFPINKTTYFQMEQVKSSNDAMRVYGYATTGFSNDGGYLFWNPLPTKL